MAKKPFQFVIVNAALQYYQVAGGTVSLTPDPVYLEPSIVDWATLSLNYRRDSVFLGVIRNYSPEAVRFVKNGAKILRYITNTQGDIEAVAYLGISLLNTTTQQYQLLDYWQFDFSMTDNQQLYFQIALIDGGLSARLKAYAGQNYQIPLNDPAAIALAGGVAPLYNPLPADLLPLVPPTNLYGNGTVPPPVPSLIYMDGIPILGQAQFVTTTDPITMLGETIMIDMSAHMGFTPGLVNSQTIGDYFATVGAVNNPITSTGIGGGPPANAIIFTENIFTQCHMKIKYDINCNYTNFTISDTHLKLIYTLHKITSPVGGWGPLVANVTIISDPLPLAETFTRNIRWKGETDFFTIPEGHMLSVGFALSGGSDSGAVVIPASDVLNPLPFITLVANFLPDSSVTRAISHFQLFQFLTTQLATNGGLLASPLSTPWNTWSKSGLLTTFRTPDEPGNWDMSPTNTFFTCGDALRGLTVNTIVDPYYNGGLPFDQYIQPAINTNMQDFAKDLFVDLCASIGIEKTGIGQETLVAESLYYFFDDNTVICDLGNNIEHDSFSMSKYNDYRGSTIAFGQEDQQFDAINGPLETVSEVDYTLPSMRVIKQIDFKSPYRREPYGIEITRANIGNKLNTNSSSDNDTFKLQVDDSTSPHLIPVLEQWGSLSGYEPVISGVVNVEALFLFRGDTISGLPAELLGGEPDFLHSMYNLVWSPQRCALRALPWLCSNYRGLVDKLMGLSAYKKNIKLVSDLGSGPVYESNWLNLSDTAQTYTPPFASTPVTVYPAVVPAGRSTALIFKPFVFSFTSPAPKNLPLLMTPPGTPGGGKMYGKIKFTFVRDGISYPLAGFVLEAGVTPGTNAAYHFKLLCSPTVDIPPLL